MRPGLRCKSAGGGALRSGRALKCFEKILDMSATRKQKVVVVTHFDKDKPQDAVEVVEKDIPTLRPGEALVKMLYSPINPSDIFSIQGIYGGFQPKLPATPGLEGVGVIEDLGPGSAPTGLPWELKIGQRVVGVPFPAAEGEGTWQQCVAVKMENLLPVKEELSDEDAAQFLVNPVTVVGMLEDIKVPSGKYLLQNAANSILGKQLISAASKKGVKTINVVRRKEVINDLKELGAEYVINSSEEDVTKRVMDITGGEGAWASLNPIGGPASRHFASSLRIGGTEYVYSMLGDDVVVPMFELHFRFIEVTGWYLTPWLASLSKEDQHKYLLETMDLMIDGTIKPPPPSAKMPLEKVKEAVLEARRISGKAGKVLLQQNA